MRTKRPAMILAPKYAHYRTDVGIHCINPTHVREVEPRWWGDSCRDPQKSNVTRIHYARYSVDLAIAFLPFMDALRSCGVQVVDLTTKPEAAESAAP